SGNFLLAQNETLAIGVLSATLLNAEQTTSGHPYLPASLNKILAADGLNLTQLHNFLVNTTEDVKIVVAHPNLYLPVDPNTITPDNAMYNTVSYLIASTLSESQVVKVYDDIQAYTGWTIRYGMVDTRLFPFSGTNTGIFYAPAELTGRVIGADGTPTSYYTLSVLGSDGNTYPINHLPADVTAVQVNINYLPAFFNTMLYHIYVGYNGTDVGAGTGIPGISGNVSSDAAMPGFMLDHFLAVYRTAYYCAGTNPTIDPGCLTATNYPDAQHLANVTKGYADTSTDQYYSGGETMLAYYTGVPLVGAVTLSDGTPVAGARVTVYDSWGTPHQSIVTAANGAYNLVLPPGNDTVNVTSGTFDGLTQAGSVHLLSMPIDVPAQEAYSFDAPTLVQNAVLQSGRVQGFVYWNTANNSSFQPSDPLATGAKVTLSLPFGATYTATTDASAAYTFSNLPPGVYNYSVTIRGSTFAQPSVTVSSTAPVNESTGLLPGRVVGSVLDSSGAVVPGAAVIALNQTGGVVTATSNSTGAYLLTTLVPGNYTIYAQVLSKSLASAPETVLLNTTITSASENLTVVPSTAFMLPVETSGYAGASGVQVRFTPILAAPPSSAVPNDSATSYTFVTSATGAATGVLPVGNYSVYAYGLIGPTYFAGIGNRAVLSSPTGNVSLAPLEMGAAMAVRGSVTIPTNSTDLTSVSDTAYDASGNQVTSYANSTGGFVIYAPPGSYTLLATLAATNASATSYSAATLVSTTSPTPVTLALTAAVRFAPTVGAPGPRSEFLPTSSGEVQVSLPNLGVRVFAPTNTTGVAHLIVPATLPGNGGSYCILAQAPGYSSFNQCGYTPLALGTVTQIPLTLNPVSVTVGLVGVPSNSTFTLNLTAASPTAQNVTTQGTTSLGVSALPGTYAVSGYAVVKGKPGFYMPLSGVTFTIPAGPPTATFSLPVHDQVRTIGVLGPLPSGIPAANVTLQLTSTIANFTLTGAAYTSPFFAPPTNYSVYATANVSSEHYAALTSVNVLSNGSILYAVTLSSAVTQTVFHLLQANNTALNTTATLTVQRGNLHLTTTTTDGLAGLFLPSDVTYTVGVNVTLLLRIGGVVQYQTFVAMPGLSCTPSGAATNCSVPLIATTHLVSLSIALRQGSTPVTLSSTIQLQGPYPSTQLITGTTTTGTFSTNLLPGHYSLYTLAGVGSDQLGNLTAILVEPTRSSTIPVQLQTTRTLTVVLVAPTSGLGTSPTLVIAGGTGANLTLANQLPQVPVSVVLPSGTYTVSANSTTTPFGVVTPARASQSISLLQGNALVTLTLSASLRYAASLAVLPPTTVELSTGGLATFPWVARNTGSAPETVKLVGSPGYLGFTFTPSSFTLGTSGTTNSTGGEVTISVPTGTSVQSPPIVLTAELSNGTVVGSTSGARVLLTAAPGVTVGASTIAPGVGPGLATVSFFVRNSGNVQVQADVTVANLAQLENFGWNVTVYNGKALVTNPVTLVEGANLTFQVNLRMIGAQAAPPGSVLLMAQTVGVAPPAHSEALLSVPTGAVQLNSTTASVTGPSVSSPPSTPTWLVPLLAFVPAMAFVVFAFVYRWSRTRRWVRT
ncbi:MAG: carboxypeptidase-like regulatory domain-containing protein, partial [Thermoplasmata archaeon]